MHSVICWRKAVHVFIPWRRAWEDQLNEYAREIQISKTARENRHRSRRGKEEHDKGAHKGRCKMNNAIREPSQKIKEDELMCGEDVAQIGAVKNVLQGGQNAHPYRRSPIARDKAA